MSIGLAPYWSSRVKRIGRGQRPAAAESLEGRALLATVVVNTLIDGIFPPGSGFTSLRNAVATANAATSGDTTTRQ